MARANAILGLRSETSLHPGTGTSQGAVDLPIQRERHTNWPCIFGSAVKGAMRAAAENDGVAEAKIAAVFGPLTDRADEHAGALAVSDARLLLFPVRSLTTHFRWVTCSAVIARLVRDAQRMGISLKLPKLAESADNTAWVAPGQGNEQLFLEDYRFSVEEKPEIKALIAAIAPLMQGHGDSADPGAARTLERQLVLVNNDAFTHLASFATAINAHVAIDSNTKTVKSGALWYEETLPEDTVMYAFLSASSERSKRPDDAEAAAVRPAPMNAKQILETTTRDLLQKNGYLQVGGNETLAMGWCRVSVLGEG